MIGHYILQQCRNIRAACDTILEFTWLNKKVRSRTQHVRTVSDHFQNNSELQIRLFYPVSARSRTFCKTSHQPQSSFVKKSSVNRCTLTASYVILHCFRSKEVENLRKVTRKKVSFKRIESVGDISNLRVLSSVSVRISQSNRVVTLNDLEKFRLSSISYFYLF